jgi:NADH-quinone oxidoreductase subunit L
VAYDIKRVLAFSTVSQLGFMMCALGAGGYTAGLFHLTTHAFFKALLFLGAGSVIHAVHTNDMREMGALSKKMPITFVTMGLATLAIAGVPPFAGYFSKEMILGAVYEHNPTMFFLLAFAAMLTAFYMTRMMVLTFLGDARDHEKHHHAHESPAPMTGPLILLAVLSVVSGWAFAHNGFIGKLLPPPAMEAAAASPSAEAQEKKAEEKPALSPENLGAVGATAAPSPEKEAGGEGEFPEALGYGVTACGLLSIAFAFMLYRGPTYPFADAVKSRFSVVFNVLERRYGFDALFLWLVDIADAIARFAFWVDANIVDKIFVDGWGLLMQILAHLSEFFDQLFIDKTVDGFGGLSWDLGVGLRSLVRAGQVQEYLMYIAVVVSLFATLILTR